MTGYSQVPEYAKDVLGWQIGKWSRELSQLTENEQRLLLRQWYPDVADRLLEIIDGGWSDDGDPI